LIEDLKDIFAAAVEAVDPYTAVKNSLRVEDGSLFVEKKGGGVKIPLPKDGRIVAVGAGKGTAPMAQALEDILGERLSGGVICVKDGHSLPLKKIRVHEASHPLPDERSLAAGEDILSTVSALGEGDLLISLLSGGGSALLTLPAEGVSLKELREVTEALLASGAAIDEVNALRKHLSRVKGGRLALAASPAKVLNLALSDVIGDSLDVIASGPFTADSSTFEDAWAVVERYSLEDKIPVSVGRFLKLGLSGNEAETPKIGDRRVDSVVNCIVGSNRKSLEAAARRAIELGYEPVILTSTLSGEARDAARFLAAIAKESLAYGDPAPPPVSFIAGGETTVTVRGPGKGGRNQEMALAFSLLIEGAEGVAMLSGGTDGTDGPTDAAGGAVDGTTAARARALGLDPRAALEENDSYNLLDGAGALVKTGPTRTNVMDVQVILLAPNREK